MTKLYIIKPISFNIHPSQIDKDDLEERFLHLILKQIP